MKSNFTFGKKKRIASCKPRIKKREWRENSEEKWQNSIARKTSEM